MVNSMNSYTMTSSWYNTIAVVTIFLCSLIGLFFNFTVVYSFITTKRQKTSFNLVCVFRACNNSIILLVAFLGIFLPATVIGYSFYPPMLETILLTTSLNLMIYNEFQGIYLSVNRLFAIFFPFKYNIFFGIKATVAFHIIYYLDRVRHLTFENMERYETSTFMLYSVEHLAYGGHMAVPDEMLIWAICLLIFPFFVNTFTYIKFYYLKKEASQSSEHLKNARKNMRLFVQTVLQDSLFSVSVIFTLKMNILSDNRLWIYFCQNFMWQIVHVLDGLIMLMFNERLSRMKRAFGLKVKPTELSGRQSSTMVHLPTVGL